MGDGRKEQSGPRAEVGTGGMRMGSARQAPQGLWNKRQFSWRLQTWAGALDTIQRPLVAFSMLRLSAGAFILCLLFPSKTPSFIWTHSLKNEKEMRRMIPTDFSSSVSPQGKLCLVLWRPQRSQSPLGRERWGLKGRQLSECLNRSVRRLGCI